jgi:hypothetical protein
MIRFCGRRQPQIPASLLLWALLIGQILRQYGVMPLKRWRTLERAKKSFLFGFVL